MKYEWRKREKGYYFPGTKPEMVVLPSFNFFMIEGKGNPNDAFFGKYIEVLYALSYGIKMSPKSGLVPEGYYEYTVYPLEGIWDISEKARQNYAGIIDKNELVFNLMIRQPDFVNVDFANEILKQTKRKKPGELIDKVRFESLAEGDCVQMMHIGSYDSEKSSFEKMEEFCSQHKIRRACMQHREIYLSDARNVPPGQLKTVLRFKIEGDG